MGIFNKFSKPPNIEKMKKNRDVKGLIKALKHKDLSVRAAAACVLGEIGDARAVGPLAQALKDKHVLVQRTVKEALEKIKAKRS